MHFVFVKGKEPAFIDGDHIPAEDEAVVRTGGLAFTSSAVMAEAFQHHHAASFLFLNLHQGVAQLVGPNDNCGDLKKEL